MPSPTSRALAQAISSTCRRSTREAVSPAIRSFAFVGTGAFTGAGQIRAVDAGADVRLPFNADGNLATVEMEILIQNLANPALHPVTSFCEADQRQRAGLRPREPSLRQ